MTGLVNQDAVRRGEGVILADVSISLAELTRGIARWGIRWVECNLGKSRVATDTKVPTAEGDSDQVREQLIGSTISLTVFTKAPFGDDTGDRDWAQLETMRRKTTVLIATYKEPLIAACTCSLALKSQGGEQ